MNQSVLLAGNKKKNRIVHLLPCLLVAVLTISTAFSGFTMQVNASAVDAEINSINQQQQQTQNEIDSVKKQKQEAQDKVDSLQDEATDIQNTHNNASSNLKAINNEIETAKNSLASTSAEIVELSAELQEAEAQQKKQYELMKLHVKYAYENRRSSSVILYLLCSESIRDLINRAEYVTAIQKSDNQVLAAYKELTDTIASKSEELEKKQAELEGYQDTLDQKQDEYTYIAAVSGTQLDAKNGEVASAQSTVDQYESQLKELDQKMASLQQAAADAQAKKAQSISDWQSRMEASGTVEYTGGTYAASDSELTYLAATIQAEAGGESYTGKLAVGSVIMNRVKSSKFPNTITGVITESGQFASYRSGKVDLIAANGPNETCLQAATEVVNGARSGNWLFFMTKSCADGYGITGYTMIGNHAFFYKWGDNTDSSTTTTTTTNTTPAVTTPTTVTNTTDTTTTDTTTTDTTTTDTTNVDSSATDTTQEAGANTGTE